MRHRGISGNEELSYRRAFLTRAKTKGAGNSSGALATSMFWKGRPRAPLT
ncbi:hypothetical protein RHECNPAF_730048 [Rhizobium etli CNPAF512]|nr:hypothetical protein RHECNPAF_730048 [Rhizobium etli CNPAF512]